MLMMGWITPASSFLLPFHQQLTILVEILVCVCVWRVVTARILGVQKDRKQLTC